MLQTFSVYVHDRPGVLNRVVSLFRKLGFNIGSLTVCRTHRQGISRMIIGADTAEEASAQVEANLYKLLDVTLVERITGNAAIEYELALIKICAAKDLRVSLPKELVDQFHARVVAQSPESLVLEATGTPDQIDVLVEILRPCIIIEMVRTGRVAMAVGPKATPCRPDAGRLAPTQTVPPRNQGGPGLGLIPSNPITAVRHDDSADLGLIHNRQAAIIDCCSQGRALNLTHGGVVNETRKAERQILKRIQGSSKKQKSEA